MHTAMQKAVMSRRLWDESFLPEEMSNIFGLAIVSVSEAVSSPAEIAQIAEQAGKSAAAMPAGYAERTATIILRADVGT